MGIPDFLSLAAIICSVTIHASVAQYYDKSGMGAIYGHSYNGGYRGLNVALGFGKGGISATGGVYGGRYDGGVAGGGGYSAGSVTSAGRGYGSGGVGGGGGGGYGEGYAGAAGYSNRYAYESGYGHQWRRRYGYRERSPYGRFPSYDYDYNGAYQFRRGRRFNNYKNDYYDY